jgi:hypothetical protein
MFDFPQLLGNRQRVNDDGIERRRPLVAFRHAVPQLGDGMNDDRTKIEALDDGWDVRLIAKSVDEEDIATRPAAKATCMRLMSSSELWREYEATYGAIRSMIVAGANGVISARVVK